MPSGVTGIMLAAGAGRRFDPSGARNKLTQRLPGGAFVAEQSLRQLTQTCDHVLVVVANSMMAQSLSLAGCQTLVCPDARLGMGVSLAFAMAHLMTVHPTCQAVLVALADMPFVQTSTLAKLHAALHAGADIVQPVYQGQGGNPVGFARRHFSDLLGLQEDRGARHLLKAFPVVQIEVDDPGILRDIDVEDDLPAIETTDYKKPAS